MIRKTLILVLLVSVQVVYGASDESVVASAAESKVHALLTSIADFDALNGQTTKAFSMQGCAKVLEDGRVDFELSQEFHKDPVIVFKLTRSDPLSPDPERRDIRADPKELEEGTSIAKEVAQFFAGSSFLKSLKAE